MIRPVLPGDISAVARALLAVPAPDRPRLCGRIFATAELAARHVTRHNRLHPRFGDGTLSAASRRHLLAPEPTYDTPDYCSCLLLTLVTLQRYLLRGEDGWHSLSDLVKFMLSNNKSPFLK